MSNRQILWLNIEKINQDCLFILSWGKGQQVKAVSAYPETLSQYYLTWQQAYTRYYQTALRGHIAEQGSLPPLDPHRQLVQAKTKLLIEFNNWLSNDRLFEIRSAIAHVIKQTTPTQTVDLFLNCSSSALEKLPWEAWEIEREIAAPVPIRIARTPANIRSEPINRYRQGGARILAIFGDQTGLDFQDDLDAIRSLPALAEIKIVSWHEGKAIPQLKTEICDAIIDRKGWDILFFAGHSRETETTGGELAIAPTTFISLSELAPYLKKARTRGLQFALFNSCNGLSIANALVDLGLSQVVIMREPIHNNVAQAFLIEFLQVLADYQDVLEALQKACQTLKEERNVDYPSADLIPSLFCHPEAALFRLEPFGLKSRLQVWWPNRHQAIALGSSILISLLPFAQNILLSGRTFIQAVYRHWTPQILVTTPPVLLVEIDEESLQKAAPLQRYPLDRKYLASLIDRLSTAKVIGIDYLLDRPQGSNDDILARSIRTSVEQKGIWFVFGAIEEGHKEIGVLRDLADLNWSLQGAIEGDPNYLSPPQDCYQICPFNYLSAVVHMLKDSTIQPKLTNKTDLRSQILDLLHRQANSNDRLQFLNQINLHPITRFSAYFGQNWLRPIADFSLPPTTIYQSLPAWQLLRSPDLSTQQVVLIASSGYTEAGIDGERDYYPTPLAVAYWRNVYEIDRSVLTGGEVHAYTIHHWLTRHLIVPIPDLPMIGLAAFLGKGITLKLLRRQVKIGIVGTVAYGLVSLQSYISMGLLLPWLLPSIVFWIYLLPIGEESSHEK